MRSDLHYEMGSLGKWAHWMLKSPGTLLANSRSAQNNAIKAGIQPGFIHVLDNVIDLSDFDSKIRKPKQTETLAIADVLTVGSLNPVKRFDRFLKALSIARISVPNLKGAIAGAGPDREALEKLAADLNLLPDSVQFLGERDDVPALLGRVKMLTLTSDHEGFPNVLMEAMAASLPVISTPAGDAEHLVRDGVTGYIVPFEDASAMAARMVQLYREPEHAISMGTAGRKVVESEYSCDHLASRLLQYYVGLSDKNRSLRFLSSPSERKSSIQVL